HRLALRLSTYSTHEILARARLYFTVDPIDSGLDAARATSLLGETGRRGTAVLAAMTNRNFLLHTPSASESLFAGFSRRQQALDVLQLHKVLLETVLGLSQESIRNQENISYLRDAGEALDRVRCGGANITFLMNPVRMEQVRDIAFAGEVL